MNQFIKVVLTLVCFFIQVTCYNSNSISFQSLQNISAIKSANSDITSDLLYIALIDGVGQVKLYKYNSSTGYQLQANFAALGTHVTVNQDATKIMVSGNNNPQIYSIDKSIIPYIIGLPVDLGIIGFASATKDLEFVSIGFNFTLNILKWNSGTLTYDLLNTFTLTINDIKAMVWADTSKKLFVANDDVQVYQFDGNSSFTFVQTLAELLTGASFSISLSCTDDGSRVVHGLKSHIWIFQYTTGGYVAIQNIGQNRDLNTFSNVAISPDGKYLAFGGANVSITNTARVYYRSQRSTVYTFIQSFSTQPTINYQGFTFSRNNEILIVSNSLYTQIHYKCKTNCNYCAPSYETCTLCAPGYDLDAILNCNYTAGGNFTVDMFGNIVQCNISFCKYCISTDTCGLCLNDYILFNNSCVCLGARTQFNGSCIPCEDSNCVNCSSVNICAICIANYTATNRTCVDLNNKTINATNNMSLYSSSLVSSSNQDLTIILIAIGVVIGLILLILLVLIVYICKKQKNTQIKPEQEQMDLNQKYKHKNSISFTEQNFIEPNLEDFKATKMIRGKKIKSINGFQTSGHQGQPTGQTKVKKAAMQNWTRVKVQHPQTTSQVSNQPLQVSYIRELDTPSPNRKKNLRKHTQIEIQSLQPQTRKRREYTMEQVNKNEEMMIINVFNQSNVGLSKQKQLKKEDMFY